MNFYEHFKFIFIVHLMYKYPEASAAEEEKRWKRILHINMNSKCRNSRAYLKAKSSAAEDNDIL